MTQDQSFQDRTSRCWTWHVLLAWFAIAGLTLFVVYKFKNVSDENAELRSTVYGLEKELHDHLHGGTALRSSCKNNLKQIGLALQNYHEDFGSYPPAFVADKKGTPLYSWRVLLLPYMDMAEAHELFDLSEPWDGPNNWPLFKEQFEVFACPSLPIHHSQLNPVTSYLAVVGPGAAWRGTRPVSKADISDNLAETILVVEVADATIPWSKPYDLDASEVTRGINSSTNRTISSWHGRETRRNEWNHPGAYILCADCSSVIFLSSPLDSEKLQAMLTIDGGESVRLD